MNHKHLIIWLLAGFLITYHTVKIYSGLVASGDASTIFTTGYYQNTVRLWIVFSLLMVIMFKRVGVISMWLSIMTLVTIQYIGLSGTLELVDYIGPLKGFIFPLLITFIYWKQGIDTK